MSKVKLEKIREMHDSRERTYGASNLNAHVMHIHIAILLERVEELEAELQGAINCTNQQEDDKFKLDVENEELQRKHSELVNDIKSLMDEYYLDCVGTFEKRLHAMLEQEALGGNDESDT